MKLSFALALTALVGTALGAVIPRGGEPEKSVSKGKGDNAFDGDFFSGSHETWNEKDRSTSDKNEKNNHEAQDLSREKAKTDEFKTHDGTDDIWTKEHVKGTKQTKGKETDESLNKDHSDEQKKTKAEYFPNGNLKETGTDDRTIKDHYGANRNQKEWTTDETFEGDRDRKEHKVDHDTDKIQSETQTDKAHKEKDSSEKSQKDQKASDKQHEKDTFAGSGGFYDFGKGGFKRSN